GSTAPATRWSPTSSVAARPKFQVAAGHRRGRASDLSERGARWRGTRADPSCGAVHQLRKACDGVHSPAGDVLYDPSPDLHHPALLLLVARCVVAVSPVLLRFHRYLRASLLRSPTARRDGTVEVFLRLDLQESYTSGRSSLRGSPLSRNRQPVRLS